jgi:hypothetical protein
MIEINLLPGKKKKPSGGAGFKLALPDIQGLLASIKNPWLLTASAASVIVVGGGLLLFITQSTRLRVLQSRLDAVRVEKRRFDAVIAQKRQSEKIRDSLVAQINIIRGIDADRYIWPHVLDQITKALPPYTWLTGVSAMGGASAPGWMRGGRLPRSMMGTSAHPGKIMGAMRADAPGPRVSPSDAAPARQPDPGRGQRQPGQAYPHLHRRYRG